MGGRVRGLIYGVCINDAPYVTQQTINGKKWRCPFYVKWYGMITRCYSEPVKRRKSYYLESSVCEAWKVFSAYLSWHKDYTGGIDIFDWQLDKDIICEGNTVYSPAKCCIIPNYVNSVSADSHKSRGPYPMGVGKLNNENLSKPYLSQIRVENKTQYLGLYATPESAHRAWQRAKIDVISDIMARYSKERFIDARVLKGLQTRVEKIHYHLKNGELTSSL